MFETRKRFLAVSGSLRAGSSNTAMLRAAASVAPQHVTVAWFDGIGTLPHFSPDLDVDGGPVDPAVSAWRAALAGIDGLLLSSPEYAHGIPGSMKNALDWVVGGMEMVELPVLIITGSGTAEEPSFAQRALVEVLRTMSASVVATVVVPAARTKLDAHGRLADPAAIELLRAAVAALVAAATPRKLSQDPDHPS